MKLTSPAKQNAVLLNTDVIETLESYKRGLNASAIMKAVTVLGFGLWIAVMLYYLVFPLLPGIQDVRMTLQRYDAYEMAYNATTQVLISLSPPEYTVDVSGDAGGPAVRTVEYVDPSLARVANLESRSASVKIDSANVSGKIVDGFSQDSMFRGFWHYPMSSAPGKRGNTVIFGHRFYKLPPSRDTFFNLDKVAVGDQIELSMDDDVLTYTVVATRVVDKTDASILSQTGDYRLTLVTCTPLWTSDKRLAVIAIQDRVSMVI